MSKYTPELREKAARAVMDCEGFVFSGDSLVAEAARGNPRVGKWVGIGDAVLRVVFPRTAPPRFPK